ncbi:MAG TPA: zinc metallopeptidase [Chitinophagales bacterium]|nr:zinc metallopeptidase [Chitinophagales bacterium]HRK26207.1 zinc metallopeptidase [Chitinophagales bacterium]
MYFLMFGVLMLLSMAVSGMLKSRFNQYSQMPIRLSGKEVAEKMLRDNGIYDVEVISVAGQLTDHYNPQNKTVNLSEAVYNQHNVAAAAVAAHECGHAIQHATAYGFLTMRSNMVPVVSISSRLSQFVLMGGLLLMVTMNNPIVLAVGVLLLAVTTLFTLITLPVEFDASNRALAWLNNANIVRDEEHEKAQNALWWAAMTYVVAALAAVANLLYYASFLFRRD